MISKGLAIYDGTIAIENKNVISSITLELHPRKIHVLMGPNGSGKSSLACALAGHPAYALNARALLFDGQDISHLNATQRARLGIFLAPQQPPALPGVLTKTFLYETLCALRGERISSAWFDDELQSIINRLVLSPALLDRSLNEGFSGGEKKKLELLQILLFKPRMIILDEIDSGLDVDALQIIAAALRYAHETIPDATFLLITHYARILHHLTPDSVFVLVRGNIVACGDHLLAQKIEQQGYAPYELCEK